MRWYIIYNTASVENDDLAVANLFALARQFVHGDEERWTDVSIQLSVEICSSGRFPRIVLIRLFSPPPFSTSLPPAFLLVRLRIFPTFLTHWTCFPARRVGLVECRLCCRVLFMPHSISLAQERKRATTDPCSNVRGQSSPDGKGSIGRSFDHEWLRDEQRF